MPPVAKKYALLIGNDRYQDARLKTLVVPGDDVRGLRSVLADPAIGAFDSVQELYNADRARVAGEIERLFRLAARDDLVLLYFSGHGILDALGRLSLALAETDCDLPVATALRAEDLRDLMETARCRRQVLILDCCYSGAFARAAKDAGQAPAVTPQTFNTQGEGRVALLSSTATQRSFEGERVLGETQRSVFTHWLVEGLRTGEAAAGEALVSEEALFQYAYDRVLAAGANMTPQRWVGRQHGRLVVARNPTPSVSRPVDPDPLTRSQQPVSRSSVWLVLALLVTVAVAVDLGRVTGLIQIPQVSTPQRPSEVAVPASIQATPSVSAPPMPAGSTAAADQGAESSIQATSDRVAIQISGGNAPIAPLISPFLGVSSPGNSHRKSRQILESCWSEASLGGPSQGVKKLLSVDHSGPPAYSIGQAGWVLPPLPDHRRNAIRAVRPTSTDERIVALTFDLYEEANETAGYQAEIINYLRAHGVKATFFVGGKWMKSHSERTMQLMADPLFEIGNHAWSHGNMRVLRGAEMRDQIIWTQAQYAVLHEELANRPCAIQVDGDAMTWIPPFPATFRFPHGTCSRESLDAVADAGLAAIQWSVAIDDLSRTQTASEIAGRILREAKPGAIVMAHANGRGWNTAEGLALAIPELQKKGYRFVTVSELLDAGTPLTAQNCDDLKSGD